MTKIGTGFIEVDADLSPFWRQVNRALSGQSTQAKKAGESVGAAFGAGVEKAGAARAVKAVQAQVKSLADDPSLAKVRANLAAATTQMSLFSEGGEKAGGQFSMFGDEVGRASKAIARDTKVMSTAINLTDRGINKFGQDGSASFGAVGNAVRSANADLKGLYANISQANISRALAGVETSATKAGSAVTTAARRGSSSLSTLNRDSQQATKGFSGLAASFGGAGDGARRTARSLDDFGGAFIGATASISGVRVALAALVPTMIAFGGASVAAASSLGPLVGLLAAAGNAAGAAAQGIGVFALATKGIGDALKEQTTNQLKAGGAAATQAGQQRASARAIQSAQDGVRNAMQGVGDATRSLNDANREQRLAMAALAPAYTEARMRLRDLRDEVVETRLALTGANLAVREARKALDDLLNGPDPRVLADGHRAVENALHGEASAARTLADAHRDLNDLLKPADALDLADAQDAVADAVRNEERSRLRLTDIIEGQDKAAQEAGISAADWAEAVKNGLDFSLAEAAGLDAAQMRLDRADAENAVGDAVRATQHARRDLAALEAGPTQQQIIDARQRVTDAERAVADAARGTQDARLDLAEIEAPATADEIASARHALAVAENDVAEATKNRVRAVRELAAAERGGIDAMTEVVQARDAIREANRAVTEAEQDLANAQLSARRASQALGDAHLAAAEQATQQASATTNLNEKMDALPPAAQAFVRELIAMKPKLDELRNTAANGFFPGATAGLRAAMGSFEEVNKVVGITSKVLGEATRKSGELVGSPAFGKDIVTIGSSNARVIDTLGEALRHVISALRHVMVAAGPLTEWLADVTNKWALNAAEAAKAGRENGKMAAFFERTRAVLERLGSIFGHVASGLLGVGKAGTKTGNEIWASIDRAARRFDEWANSVPGQKALHRFFQETTALAAAIAPILGGIISAITLLSLRLLPLAEVLGVLGPLTNEIVTAWILYKLAIAGVGLATKAATAAIWVHNAAMAVQSVNMVRWRIAVGLAAISTGIMTAAQWALNVALTANPIGLIIVAIGALVAAFVIAYKNSETFRDIIADTWKTIQKVVDAAVGFIVPLVTGAWNALRSVSVSTWVQIGLAVLTPVRAAQAALAIIWPAIRSVATNAWEGMRSAASAIWSAIREAILSPIRTARDLIPDILAGMANRLAAGWGVIRGAATLAWNTIRDLVLTPIRAAREALPDIVEGMKNRLETGFLSIIKALGGWAGDIKDKIVGAFEGAADKVKDFINIIIRAINKIPGIPNIKELATGGTYGGEPSRGGPNGTGRIQGFAHGGAFARTGGYINRPITLMGEDAPSAPEWVIPTKREYRGRALDLWAAAGRSLGVQGLAEGGVVSAFRSAIKRTDAGPKPSLALWMAGIVESGLRNLTYGDRDSLGALQVRAGIHGRDLAMDPLRSALAFLNRGFTGIGGAIPLAPRYATAGQLAQAVQGSGFPHRYDAVRDEALQYLNGKDGSGSGSLLGKITGIVGDLLSKGAGFILNQLPGIGSLPDWLKGTGKYVLDKATDYIKDAVSGLIGSGGGQGGEGTMTGTNAKAQRLAEMFNATITSGFRNPAHNASVGGVAGSSHTKGSPSNPGAHDFVPASTELLNEALKMGAKWVDNHDFGSGLHSHVSWFREGGMYGGLPFVGSFEQGGRIPRDGMAYVHRDETVTPAGQPTIEDVIAALRSMNIYIGNERIAELVDVRADERQRAERHRFAAGRSM